MDFLFSPWPWYVSGPLIAVSMAMLLFAGKRFGVSSNFQTLCTIGGAGKFSDYFQLDWKERKWNLAFVLGSMMGGAISSFWMRPGQGINMNQDTIALLSDWGLHNPGTTFAPPELFSPEVWGQPHALGLLLVGGALIGFGTRYADGCTSGHAISGLSSFQLPSLIAVIGFFIGGLTVTHFVLPHLF